MQDRMAWVHEKVAEFSREIQSPVFPVVVKDSHVMWMRPQVCVTDYVFESVFKSRKLDRPELRISPNALETLDDTALAYEIAYAMKSFEVQEQLANNKWVFVLIASPALVMYAGYAFGWPLLPVAVAMVVSFCAGMSVVTRWLGQKRMRNMVDAIRISGSARPALEKLRAGPTEPDWMPSFMKAWSARQMQKDLADLERELAKIF